MPFSLLHRSEKGVNKADEQPAVGVSHGESPSTSRPGTPSSTKKPKNIIKFWPSRSKNGSRPASPSPPAATQQEGAVQATASVPHNPLITAPITVPFKGDPNERAHEAEIYNRGILAVTCLQKLSGLTGSTIPNPVPVLLEALVSVLTQLQQMVKNDGDWKALFLLIVEHLNTFNHQLGLLKLGNVESNPQSALHGPIIQYSSTLRALTARVLTDANFDPDGQQEKSDWEHLKGFVRQFTQAGEIQEQILEYKQQLTRAMDLLLRELSLFSAVKGEETNLIVKEVHSELKEVHMAVQKMSDMIVPIAAISIRVVAKSPPAVSPHFVVRKQEMDRMMKHLARSTDTKQKAFAITGMGGSGKTQLVSYFLQEMNGNKELFSHVVFVDARSEASLKTDLQLWAQSLGAGHEADDWNNGLEILATDLNDGSWVLIFDNADDPSLKLKKYFPRCSSGTIVFTSRNWEVGNLANTDHLELEKMSQGDALATLEKAAHRRLMEPSQELESAKTLMDELGCLPLALVHAGTYCHRQSSIIDGQDHLFTFTQYLNLFRKKRAALMNKKGVTTQEDYEHGVYTALDLSYQAINGSSKQFLHIISQFHYSEIPLAMFLEAAKAGFQDPRVFLPRPAEHRNVINQLTTLLCPDGEADEFQLRELIGDLRSFSLVSPSEGSLFLRLHPLVQAWIRDMRPAEPQDYQTMAKQIIISCCLSTNIRIYRYLLPHIEEIIGKDEGVDLHVNDQMALELVYRELGRYDDAETLIEFASNSMREQSDKETEDTLYIEGRLAAIYMHQDLWYQAEELQLFVLERRRIVLSADHPDIIDAASNLAVVYINQERWNEAEPLQLEVLENRQKRLGPLHSRSIDAMTNLAVAYKGQGRLEEAVALEKEAVEMHKQIGTIDMPNGIQAQQNLATMYAKQGKWDEAEKLQMAVLEKQRALLGASHPTSINTVFFLADMYRNEGKWEDAEGIMEIAVTQSIEVMGKLDPRTQFYISILIDVYEELGKLEKAREMEELIVKLE